MFRECLAFKLNSSATEHEQPDLVRDGVKEEKNGEVNLTLLSQFSKE